MNGDAVSYPQDHGWVREPMPKSRRKYYAVLDRYDTITDDRGRFVEDRLPANVGKVHAYATFATIKTVNVGGQRKTLCDVRAKALLPIEFDPGDPDACQTCAAEHYRRMNR